MAMSFSKPCITPDRKTMRETLSSSDVQFYDPKNMDVESFINNNLGGEVLIVGHSNSTPELVNKFIGEEKYPSMDDSDNSSLFIVRIINGIPTDIRLKMD